MGIKTMSKTHYHFTPDNDYGQTEIIVTYDESHKTWIALISPKKDEWLDGDVQDLIDCLTSALTKMQELKEKQKVEN